MDKLTYMQQLDELLHNPLTLVFLLATADVITGLLKAKFNKNYQSNIFKKGLVTHSLIVVGLFIFSYYASDYDIQPLVMPISLAFGGMYISSIYENYKEMGGNAPKKIDNMIDEIKEKVEKED